MEATARWSFATAVAPIAWGTTYFVTQRHLPADHPLYGAVFRALPAGIALLALSRRRPHGALWWKALVLGTLNMGAFFALVYMAAQLLPISIASTVMATSPVVMMLLAWPLLAERPHILPVIGAGIGIAGVCVMLLTNATGIDALGVLASVAAMTMSSVGFILTKKWCPDADILALTSWQLIAGGAVLVPVAVAVEGAPPSLDGSAVVGFVYLSGVTTALAFTVWFAGLRRLSAGTVGLIGLLNPVTGVLLGTLVAGDTLTARQGAGLVLVFVGIALGQPIVTRALRARRGRRSPAGGDASESPDSPEALRPRQQA